MDNQETDNPWKRKTLAMAGKEEGEVKAVGAAGLDVVVTDEAEETVESEEMKQELSCIVEKIESFTQLRTHWIRTLNILLVVSELLEFGKKIFKELTDEFEDRIIMIHKEKIDIWQEEMRDLRVLDASNEEIKSLVQKAQYLLHSIQA